MNAFRRIFVFLRARPVLVLWIGASAFAAILWLVADRLEARRSIHARQQAAYDSKFFDLAQRVGRFRLLSKEQLEQRMLNGEKLLGETETLNVWVTEPGSRLLDTGTYLPTPVPGVAPAQSLRVTLDGTKVSPRFTGWTIRLHFLNNYLRGATAQGPPRLAYTGPSRSWQTHRQLLGVITCAGAAVGVICLWAVLMAPQSRRRVALIGLAAALLSGVAAGVYPAAEQNVLLRQPETRYAWFSITGLLALLATIPSRRRSLAHIACAGCRYDLTGNESGVCPECGRPTPAGLVERWRDRALAIEQAQLVATDLDLDRPNILTTTRLLEMKPDFSYGEIAAFFVTIAATSGTCYRWNMSIDRAADFSGDDPSPLTDTEASGETDAPASTSFACPHCGHLIVVQTLAANGLISCLSCGGDFFGVVDPSEEDRELERRFEAERQLRAQHLNDARIAAIKQERRAIVRTRSYFIMGLIFALAIAIQLGVSTYARLQSGGFSLRVSAYLGTILAAGAVAMICLKKIREIHAELARPVQEDPATPPDFSTLSDGSHVADEMAQSLAKMRDASNR